MRKWHLHDGIRYCKLTDFRFEQLSLSPIADKYRYSESPDFWPDWLSLSTKANSTDFEYLAMFKACVFKTSASVK